MHLPSCYYNVMKRLHCMRISLSIFSCDGPRFNGDVLLWLYNTYVYQNIKHDLSRVYLPECAKTWAQISFAVTAKLISAFVFRHMDITIPHLLMFKISSFRPASVLVKISFVGPVRKSVKPVFSRRGSLYMNQKRHRFHCVIDTTCSSESRKYVMYILAQGMKKQMHTYFGNVGT